jgi:hypothetical protein
LLTSADDLHRKLRSGRLALTVIKPSLSSNQQIPVPPAELNDLVFRFTPDDPVVPVGLWSRSRGLLVWRSPRWHLPVADGPEQPTTQARTPNDRNDDGAMRT